MKEQLEQTRIFNAASSFNKFWNTKVKLNGIYSRNNLPKIKDETNVINFDEYKSIGTRWIALYANGNYRKASYDAIYFDSFRVEHIVKEIKQLIENKNMITNIYRIQAYDLIMCAYFCIGFIDFMLKSKRLLDYMRGIIK